MKQNGFLMARRYCHVTAIVLTLFALSACVTTDQNGTSQTTESPAPPKEIGHVVKIKHYLPVRVAPALQSKKLGRLFLQDAVYIDEEKMVSGSGWYRITSIKGNAGQSLAGWVLSRYIEKGGAAPSTRTAVGTTEKGQEKSTDLTDQKVISMAGNVLFGTATVATGGTALTAVTALASSELMDANSGNSQKGYQRVSFNKIIKRKSQEQFFDKDIFTTAIFKKTVRSPMSGRGVTGYVNLRLCNPENHRSCQDLFLLAKTDSDAINELSNNDTIRIFGTMRPKSNSRGAHFYITRFQKMTK